METYVQNQLFGHGFSIPEPIKNFGLSHSDLVEEESGNIESEEGFGSWGRKSASNLAKPSVRFLLQPRSGKCQSHSLKVLGFRGNQKLIFFLADTSSGWRWGLRRFLLIGF
jgi:hypothetical protein